MEMKAVSLPANRRKQKRLKDKHALVPSSHSRGNPSEPSCPPWKGGEEGPLEKGRMTLLRRLGRLGSLSHLNVYLREVIF